MKTQIFALIAAVTISGPALSEEKTTYLADYQKCIEEVDGQGAGAFEKCAAVQFEKMDAALNSVYAAAMKNTNLTFRGNLRDSERAWLICREKTCYAEAYLAFGDAGFAETKGACFIEITQERLNWLHKTIDRKN